MIKIIIMITIIITTIIKIQIIMIIIIIITILTAKRIINIREYREVRVSENAYPLQSGWATRYPAATDPTDTA